MLTVTFFATAALTSFLTGAPFTGVALLVLAGMYAVSAMQDAFQDAEDETDLDCE